MPSNKKHSKKNKKNKNNNNNNNSNNPSGGGTTGNSGRVSPASNSGRPVGTTNTVLGSTTGDIATSSIVVPTVVPIGMNAAVAVTASTSPYDETMMISRNPQDAELIVTTQQQQETTASTTVLGAPLQASNTTTVANNGGGGASGTSGHVQDEQQQRQLQEQRQQYDKDRYQNDPRIGLATVAVFGVLLCLIVPTMYLLIVGEGVAERLAMGSPRDKRLPDTWEELVKDTKRTFQAGFEDIELPTMFLGSIHGLEMIFFDDTAFYSWELFLQKMGNTDVKTSLWTVPLRKTHIPKLGMVSDRNITYLHPVSNPLAPPMARAHKRQRLERYRRHSVLIQSWTEVRDVPLADCFVVEDRLLIRQFGTKNITVSSYFNIEFTKDTMFRSIIEQQTTKEYKELLHEYYRYLTIVSFGRPQDWSPLVMPTTRVTTPTTTGNNGGRGLPFLKMKNNPIKKVGSILSHPIRPVITQAGRFIRFIGKLGKKKEQHARTTTSSP